MYNVVGVDATIPVVGEKVVLVDSTGVTFDTSRFWSDPLQLVLSIHVDEGEDEWEE